MWTGAALLACVFAMMFTFTVFTYANISMFFHWNILSFLPVFASDYHTHKKQLQVRPTWRTWHTWMSRDTLHYAPRCACPDRAPPAGRVAQGRTWEVSWLKDSTLKCTQTTHLFTPQAGWKLIVWHDMKNMQWKYQEMEQLSGSVLIFIFVYCDYESDIVIIVQPL